MFSLRWLAQAPQPGQESQVASGCVDYEQTLAALLARFDEPLVDELLLDGSGALVLAGQGGSRREASPFADAQGQLVMFVQELARRQGTRLDPLCGSAGGCLAGERYRWHCVLPPLSRDGPLLSLRRHRFDCLTVDDFAGTDAVKGRLRQVAKQRRNILIAGPTACGKTTLLAALLGATATDERVVLVESLPELPRLTPGCVRLVERRPNLEGVGGVSLTRLIYEALRLRPDRLIVGEIRSTEAGAFLETLATGHQGVMATIHAGTVDEALARLILLAGDHARAVFAGTLEIVLLARGARPSLVSVESRSLAVLASGRDGTGSRTVRS